MATVKYQIDLKKPEHHLGKITINLDKGHDLIIFKMPVWRTGNYKILNQANGVRNFSATNSRGKSLDWIRLDKSSWQVNNPTQAKIKVSYQIYANELGSRTRHINSTHAYLDATAVLMYIPSMMKEKHIVNLKVPKKWHSFSGMEQSGKHRFIAQNYDQLADSPIETGINDVYKFTQDKRNYEVVFWGKSNRDNQSIVNDLKSLVVQSQTIWKGYPYQKYVFIIHATSGAKGATEHINSTVIQRDRTLFGEDDDYLKYFLRTASHELIHTWNVKAYRPQGLVPYDYEKENYSQLLWIAEGSTSYFQDRLLLTAELQTVDEFLVALSKRIDDFKHTPGNRVQSVSESSFEKWIAQGGDFAKNHSANIYSEGFMASWLLDFEILQDTQLKQGYKDLHQQLYPVNHKNLSTNSYTTEKVQQLLQKITQKDYTKWWHKNIDQPLNIDFEKLIDKAGLRFAKLKEEDYKVWTGFVSEDNNNIITLKRVEKDSPAWNAGLTSGDQLIAINGYKVTAAKLDKWLLQFNADDKLKLTLFRDDQLLTKTLKLKKAATSVPQIELIEEPSEQQKLFFKAWLGVDHLDQEEIED